jgi:hypothetical protein
MRLWGAESHQHWAHRGAVRGRSASKRAAWRDNRLVHMLYPAISGASHLALIVRPHPPVRPRSQPCAPVAVPAAVQRAARVGIIEAPRSSALG